MSITIVYDCISVNLASAPAGPKMGYVTGAPGSGVEWTPEQWAANPTAVKLAQAPLTQEDLDAKPYPDGFDMETGAIALDDLPLLCKDALASYHIAAHPGQRSPFVYMSADNVTPVVNALIAGGVTSGIGLDIANWGETSAQAIAQLTSAGGPFPVISIQIKDAGPYDYNLMSTAWWSTRTAKPIVRYPDDQTGEVKSATTGLSAKVRTIDGGKTWLYAG